MPSALLIVGPPGAGKSSLLREIGAVLELAGVPFGSLESEQLAQGWPLLDAGDWVPQLAEVVRLQRRAGRDRLIIVATPESSSELTAMVEATRPGRTFVVGLSATPELVADRLDLREPDRWPGKKRLIERARELAAAYEAFDGVDLRIETELRESNELASLVLAEWRHHEEAAEP